jgi:subtilisin family serine protease
VSVSATGPIGFNWGEAGLEEPFESPAFYTNYGTNAVTVAAPGGDADLDAIGTGVPWYLDLVYNTLATPKFRYEDVDDDSEEEPVEYLSATYTYGWLAGTSMAAPQVAGAAALVKAENPEYNANQVESVLKRTATVPEGYEKAYYGAGVIDPAAAVGDPQD